MDFPSILDAIPDILERIEGPIGVISLIVILFSFITWAFFSREGPGFKVFAIVLLFVGCAGIAFAVLQHDPAEQEPLTVPSTPPQDTEPLGKGDRVVQEAEHKPMRTPLVVGPDGLGSCQSSNELPKDAIDVDDLKLGTGWLRLRDYHPGEGWFSTTKIRTDDGQYVDPNTFKIINRSGNFVAISDSTYPHELLGKVIRVSNELTIRERPYLALNDFENTARYDGTTDVCVQYVLYNWEPSEVVDPCLPGQPCEPSFPEQTDVWVLVNVME